MEPEVKDFCALTPGRSLYKALLYSLLAAAARALSSLDSLPEDLLELGLGIPDDDAGIDDDDDDVGIDDAVDETVFEDLPDDEDEDCVFGMPVRLPILEAFFEEEEEEGVGLAVARRESACRGSVCL